MSTQKQTSKSPVNIAVAEACIIGLFAALGAVVLKSGVGLVGSIRVTAATENVYALPLFGLLGGAFAGLLIQFFAPHAAGSGIPQTKGALGGAKVRLDLTTAFVKLISCIVSLGSGLALGREGPTVQVAAALASKFSGWLNTSPTHRIQLIASGAGAGLAAAFNAPLAGVLFVLEELVKKMSGLAVGTTVVACFVAAVTSRLVGVHSLDLEMSEIFSKATFQPIDIPFLLILGVIAGVTAALFNKAILAALTINRDVLKLPIMMSSSIAGLCTGLIVMKLPELYHNYAGLRAMIMLPATDCSIILTALVMQFVLTILAYGMNVPGGLFAPSLMLGACLGHLVALLELSLTNSGDVGTMAVVGMGAFFCAVARVPMTAVVIVFEMTQDFNVVLPLMICCMVAYLVAEKIDPGSLYDRLLLWSGINLEEDSESRTLSNLTAYKIMTRQVSAIPITATLASVKATFETVNHRGFPVVDDQRKVVGIVCLPDLKSALEKNLRPDTPVKKFMSPKPITVSAEESLAGVLFLMDRHKVSRLPVAEHEKLVGIITRKDIVSAESSAFSVRTTSGTSSYVVYQTRSPESRHGRLLVALGDPKEADPLVRIAGRVASHQNLDLECLHVIKVPSKQSPSSQLVSTEDGRELLVRCEALGRSMQIPVHTSIRVAHEVASAIAEALAARNVGTLLMRYAGNRKTNKSDALIQSVLSGSNVSVVLIGRLFGKSDHSRFIIPVGEFLDEAMPSQICFSLAEKTPEITLCKVTHPKRVSHEEELTRKFQDLKDRLTKETGKEPETMEVVANSPAALLMSLKSMKDDEVLLLGLPRRYLAKSINKGVFKNYLNKLIHRRAIVITSPGDVPDYVETSQSNGEKVS